MRVIAAGVAPSTRAFLVDALRGADQQTLRHSLDAALQHATLDEVMAVARDYVILPTVAFAALSVGVDEAGADGDGRLRDVVEQTTIHNAGLLETLGAATDALTRAGVPSIALKGAALFAAGHMPLGARHTDDVDLLVDAAAADRAVCALQRAGFAGSGVFFDDTTTLQREGGVAIDLHRRAPGSTADLTTLLVDSEVVEVAGVTVTVPSAAALLAQLCDHVVVRHAMWPRYWPRHVADLARLVARTDPGARLLEGPVALSLAVAAGVLDDDAPAPLTALARFFVLPGTGVAAAHGARFVARRALAEAKSGRLAAFFPDEAWLRRSGDLRDDRTLWQARAARLARIAALARGKPR